MYAATTEAVVAQLDRIIADCAHSENPLGYFAALYRRVTMQVRADIAAGVFDDGARMEQFDVVFANRYLAAYAAYETQTHATASWQYAFESSTNGWLTVLQHLLLGMNAHINLDLGIAAEEVSRNADIEALHTDFDRINAILESLVSEVEARLEAIFPMLFWMLKATGQADTFLVKFSIETARDGAWAFAKTLAALPEEGRAAAIVARDGRITEIGLLVTQPGAMVSTIFKAVRVFERGTVAERIQVLAATLA